MKAADNVPGPRYVVVLGERDLEAGVAQPASDLGSGEQVAVALADTVDTIEKRLR